jgi:hypothetical protein
MTDVDFSRLEDPEFYRGRLRPVPSTRGKATHPSGDHEVIDPQPVHMFKARHPKPAFPAAGRASGAASTPMVTRDGAASDPAPIPLSWRIRAAAYRLRWTLFWAAVLVLSPIAGWFSAWFPTLADGSTARLVSIFVLGVVSGASLALTWAVTRRTR